LAAKKTLQRIHKDKNFPQLLNELKKSRRESKENVVPDKIEDTISPFEG